MPENPNVCPVCGKRCATKRGLGVHQFKMHQKRVVVRCPPYTVRVKLLQHDLLERSLRRVREGAPLVAEPRRDGHTLLERALLDALGRMCAHAVSTTEQWPEATAPEARDAVALHRFNGLIRWAQDAP